MIYREISDERFCQTFGTSKETFAAEDVVTYTTETKEAVIATLIDRLNQSHEITGIVCYNDEIAHGLIQQLQPNGKRCTRRLFNCTRK